MNKSTTFRETYDIDSFKYLQVNSCGSIGCSIPDHTVIRKNGRSDYHVIYVCGGNLDAIYDGKEYKLTAGDFILYPPQHPHNYKRYTGVSDHWIHFNGFCVEEILNDSKLTLGVHKCKYDPYTERLFKQLSIEHQRQKEYCQSAEAGILLTILNVLGESSRKTYDGKSDSRISETIAYINDNYNKELTLSSLASICHLSESRFSSLFKKELGVSPLTYIRNVRIEHCKELLLYTDLSVGEIAEISGYQDQLYFSRLFKKHTGISPSRFRNMD